MWLFRWSGLGEDDVFISIYANQSSGGNRSVASPGKGLGTLGADVGLFHATLVGAHMVAHAVFPLESLLADGAGERLLV